VLEDLITFSDLCVLSDLNHKRTNKNKKIKCNVVKLRRGRKTGFFTLRA